MAGAITTTSGRDQVLDRTVELATIAAEAERPGDEALQARRTIGSPARRVWQFFVTQSFSSLTRRIVFLNVTGLFALVIGVLYLSQFRAGLIDARAQSLLIQGRIIAGAIASSATIETNAIKLDPERLMELQAGQSYRPGDEGFSALEFSINPERVAPVLKALVSPTK